MMKQPHAAWDVLVIGAGPAGAATAFEVARAGYSVLVIEQRTSPGNKFGESLPPAAVPVVERLSGPLSAQTMHQWGIARTRGNVAAWYSPAAEQSDFFFTPEGHGLAINRTLFDRAVINSARAEGAGFQFGTRADQVHRAEVGKWRLALNDGNGGVETYARFVVDASGRASMMGRRLGVERYCLDHLFAFGQTWISAEADNDPYTRIEAVEDGWWYSQKIPADRHHASARRVVFHTDRDLPVAWQAGNQAGFSRLLERTEIIRSALHAHGYRPQENVRGADAASARLSQFAGDGWLAVGDASQAFDPLSSQGIFKALTDGADAGRQLCNVLRDASRTRTLFRGYAQRQAHKWLDYSRHLQYVYFSQKRWSQRPFWNRRGHENPGVNRYQMREVS